MDNILKLSQKLISLPSVAHDKSTLHEVLHVAKEELDGFTVEEFEKDGAPSLLAYSSATRPEKFKIILNAHLDVVSAHDNQYEMVEKDGKLHGRGTWDMKTAAAAEIIVFKEVAKTVSYPIALQLVTDEETGGFLGTKYQVEQGVRGDFIIAGEPTDLGINNQSKGIMWVNLTVRGKAAHAAYPWNGENAILKMNTVLEKIMKLFPIPEKEEWKTTINVAKISTSNETLNKVPDECSASLDIRFIPDDSKTIRKTLEDVVKDDASLEFLVEEPAQFTHHENDYIKKLDASLKAVTGKPGEVIVKHGGADIRHYERVGNHGITFGPKGAGLHGDEEWVDKKSLEEYYEVLKNFLLHLDP